MKENREYQLKVRLTNRERDWLVQAAEAADMTISEFVRAAIFRSIGGQSNGSTKPEDSNY